MLFPPQLHQIISSTWGLETQIPYLLKLIRIKVEAAEGQCRVNVKFWGGVVPGNAPHLREMIQLGVPGFKCFLIHSGVDEFPAVDRDQVCNLNDENFKYH